MTVISNCLQLFSVIGKEITKQVREAIISGKKKELTNKQFWFILKMNECNGQLRNTKMPERLQKENNVHG